MRLVWRPLALDDDFEAKAEQARQHPKSYKTGRVPGTRGIVVLPNYVMVYRINGDELTILRVLHARQQWPAQR